MWSTDAFMENYVQITDIFSRFLLNFLYAVSVETPPAGGQGAGTGLIPKPDFGASPSSRRSGMDRTLFTGARALAVHPATLRRRQFFLKTNPWSAD